jgi:hypothetical protein
MQGFAVFRFLIFASVSLPNSSGIWCCSENVDRRVNKVNLPKRRDVQAPHLPERKEYGPRRAGSNQDSPNDMPLNLSGENRDRHESSEARRKEFHTRSRYHSITLFSLFS